MKGTLRLTGVVGRLDAAAVASAGADAATLDSVSESESESMSVPVSPSVFAERAAAVGELAGAAAVSAVSAAAEAPGTLSWMPWLPHNVCAKARVAIYNGQVLFYLESLAESFGAYLVAQKRYNCFARRL